MNGPSAVDVYFEGPNEGDAVDDDFDGRDEVMTQMKELELRGRHVAVGDVILRLNEAEVTLGQIEEQVNHQPGVWIWIPSARPRRRGGQLLRRVLRDRTASSRVGASQRTTGSDGERHHAQATGPGRPVHQAARSDRVIRRERQPGCHHDRRHTHPPSANGGGDRRVSGDGGSAVGGASGSDRDSRSVAASAGRRVPLPARRACDVPGPGPGYRVDGYPAPAVRRPAAGYHGRRRG